MGKRLEAQIKQQARYYHKKAKEPYKGPYDCPVCFLPKSLNLKKLEETGTTITWIAICDKCNLFQKITLPKSLGEIDLYNKISDKVRGGKI